MFPIYLLCRSYKSTGRGSGGDGEEELRQALRLSCGCKAVKTGHPHPREGRREGRRQRWREEPLPQASWEDDDEEIFTWSQ